MSKQGGLLICAVAPATQLRFAANIQVEPVAGIRFLLIFFGYYVIEPAAGYLRYFVEFRWQPKRNPPAGSKIKTKRTEQTGDWTGPRHNEFSCKHKETGSDPPVDLSFFPLVSCQGMDLVILP